MVEYIINELCSIDAIFDFFNKSNYEIEDDRSAFPISELIEKPVEGDAWLIVNHTNLMVIAIRAEKFNQKTYRTKVNNYLKELAGMKLIFYTDEFDYYHLTLIYDGIFSIKFKPSDPDMMIVRIFEALESGEDLFDFTRQDINFILLKRELTAKALKDSIKEGENSSVKIVFQDGGLKLIGEGSSKIIVAHEDAPIRDLVINVNLNSEVEQIEQEFVDTASDLYENYCSRKLKLICMITKKGIIYYWIPYSISGFISYKNPMDEDVMDAVLESLIAQVSYRTAFNSDTFHQQFGTHSPFFILGTKSYIIFFDQELEKIKIMYEEWKTRFSKVYQAGDLDQDLFIKHAYLALLLKTVLISKFVGLNENNQPYNLQKIIEVFEERGVPIFLNDFFQWTSEEENVQNEIFETLHNADFIIDDLFRTIYQEMVSPETRHALGEFYTPPPLAEKMVEEVYHFGQYVLDPACGSGTFLVQVLKSIENTNNSNEKKIEAISKIYGFDVNPIAILVARSNLLLLTDKIFGTSKKIPINIYLADSLNPINEFTPIIEDKKTKKKHKFQSFDKWHNFGEIERFNMPAINDFLVINIKFFKYSDYFNELLKALDFFLAKNLDFNVLLESIYDSTNDSWLDETCEGETSESLRANFEHIAKKLYGFIKENKNHIWVYLLFNAIGVRKMQETMDGVDLLIGNPPWLTIHDIKSHLYKRYLKGMAKDLGIYIGGSQSPHVDLCSIFFYMTSKLYLRKNGRIFYITTTALETGEQHAKFRLFEQYKEIFLWKFKKDVFKIRNICLGATYAYEVPPLEERLQIDVKIFNVDYINKQWIFDVIKNDIYVPYNIEYIKRDLIAKRLIPKKKLANLLPQGKSYYFDKFYNGACLYPRNLLFVDIVTAKENNLTIKPNIKIGSKNPWKFKPFKQIEVENKYIFRCAKSTELVPFNLLTTHKIFLPIEKEDYDFHKESIQPKAKKLFKLLSNKYKEIQEKDERNQIDFWENINHINKLTNPRQREQIKVIFPGSGKFIKSAIINDENIIIDTKLYYYPTNNLDEAYYICAILNSNAISEDLKYRSSTGFQGKGAHIHKRALEYDIPKFDEDVDLHKDIAKIGKETSNCVEVIIKNLKENEIINLKKKIQCKYCGKLYIKRFFDRNRESHEKNCIEVNDKHLWLDNDWIDLKDISLDNISLTQGKAQNAILNDLKYKEKIHELDNIIKQLINPEG